MYLGGAQAQAGASGSTLDVPPDEASASFLLDQVRSAFPHVRGSGARVSHGGDHLVLLADGYVFRFPRRGRHGPELEMEVLRRLRPLAAVAVPGYDIVDPQGRFAGYRIVDGVPLSTARFEAMDAPSRRAVLADLVAAVRALHGIDPNEIAPAPAWPRLWSAERFAERLESERLPLLADRLPRLRSSITSFLDRYRRLRSDREVVVHGDLVWEHLLVDPRSNRLSGMIDFGDVALGDPAYDLMGLWAYGAAAVTRAASIYRTASPDPDLRARSHAHHVRYRLDRTFEAIAERPSTDVTPLATELERLLARREGIEDQA